MGGKPALCQMRPSREIVRPIFILIYVGNNYNAAFGWVYDRRLGTIDMDLIIKLFGFLLVSCVLCSMLYNFSYFNSVFYIGRLNRCDRARPRYQRRWVKPHGSAFHKSHVLPAPLRNR